MINLENFSNFFTCILQQNKEKAGTKSTSSQTCCRSVIFENARLSD